MDLPKNVAFIVETLNLNGYAAYVVGGCVRDSLMGIEPHDWDITTSATPEEVRKLFENIVTSNQEADIRFKVIPTGEKYGTMTVEVIEKWKYNKCDHLAGIYEITTFRSDSEYSDGRRPDKVTFGESILEDLARRDFTMNAIAYNPLVGYIDPFDGINDIKNKIVKAVGDADTRIREDALRILRGIRFACKYKFKLENCTSNVIAESGSLLKNVSKERIQSELLKILTYSDDANKLLNECAQVFEYIFELNSTDQYEENLRLSKWKSNQFIDTIDNNNPISVKLFNMLRLYKKKYESEIWLRKYKFSNDMITLIMRYYDIEDFLDKNFSSYHESNRYDILIKTLYNKFKYSVILKYIDNDAESRLNKIITKPMLDRLEQEPYSISSLKIGGWEIKSATSLEGKAVGDCLDYLVERIIEDKTLNNKDKLMELIKDYEASLV